MNTVWFITPEGIEAEVPESDAAYFDSKGWPRAGSRPDKYGEIKAYADMSMKELKAVLAERNIEADGKKEDLIAALELADEESN